jgi:hypothetical protein
MTCNDIASTKDPHKICNKKALKPNKPVHKLCPLVCEEYKKVSVWEGDAKTSLTCGTLKKGMCKRKQVRNKCIDTCGRCGRTLFVKGISHSDSSLNSGSYIILDANALQTVLGNDDWMAKTTRIGNLDYKSGIKANEGMALRVKNERTRREGGLLLWFDGQIVFGTWNSVGFLSGPSTFEEWEIGDKITFLDFPLPGALAEVSAYSGITATNWNLDADAVRFGQSGLVGNVWREMEIEYDLEEGEKISGVWTDSITLPYSVKYYNEKSKRWVTLKENCKGSFEDDVLLSVPATRWRLHWDSTALDNTGGLSTFRSGGGIHAELLTP